jgi:DNA-binding transcriptional LysR family regulator
MGTILSLVARGIGIAALPRLALAAGEARVAVRELPAAGLDRDVYAVARASSVHWPSGAAILAAVHSAASNLSGRRQA